jgi:hypothetical protein
MPDREPPAREGRGERECPQCDGWGYSDRSRNIVCVKCGGFGWLSAEPGGAPVRAEQWRKKPVTITAVRWTGDNLREVIAFTGRHPSAADWTWEHFEEIVRREGLKIFTLEGSHLATPGDYIIRGVKGEFYPCKPDIFALTYEPAALSASLPAGERPAVPEVEGPMGLWNQRVASAVFVARTACRGKGYALGIHGSLRRDIDAIAAPWTETAASPREVAHHVLDRLTNAGHAVGWGEGGEEGNARGNGRHSWAIVLTGDPFLYLDLSVMSPLRAPAPAEGSEPPSPVDRRMPNEDARDAVRYRVLRPLLFVGEVENGDAWGLWAIAHEFRERENIPAIYWRMPSDGEEERSAAGEPMWGPDVDAMVDEMAARASGPGPEGGWR